MAKYLLITPGYPSTGNKYNNAFVHSRVKKYLEEGLNVEVFSVSRKPFAKPKDGMKYTYDSISIELGNVRELREKLKWSDYDKILIHFGYKRVVSAAIKAVPETPFIIWFHGVDIIAWYRRLYNLRLKNVIKFAGYAVLNTLQRCYLHHTLKKRGDNIHCVFVSEWLKATAEKDIHLKGRIKHFSIIPNIVDSKAFPYRKKQEEDRLKILSIRPFRSKNYANDLTVKAICELSKRPFFGELRFTICGDGRLWKSTVEPLKRYSNVELQRRFFSHEEIAELHSRHGVMLMPSRQDTQGISTCEGMSSGLVPVTSNNSAIPEFIPESCGYLTNNYLELAEVIEDIYNNPGNYLIYSEKASVFIQGKCSGSVIIKTELDLIKSKAMVN